jgi:Tannase and feruloyl esterase
MQIPKRWRTRRVTRWLGACLGMLALTFGQLAHASDTEQRSACSSLASLSAADFKVQTAEWVGATRLTVGPAGTALEVPDHCLFRVTLDPRPSDLDNMSYGTGIELRLPANWNGRFLFQGGGGLNGVLLPAVGAVGAFPSALARGFAVVSTDSGHRGKNALDSRFGVDQQAKLDFAYQAVARTTVQAKSLIARFYGKQPDRSYYMGCSTGGREAMLAAERLPLEFDGVVAGNPSYNLTRVAVNQIWSLQTVARIAPQDATGKPDLSRAFSDEQLKSISAAVLRECDALDGLRDGMINDFQACRFDPKSMVCGKHGAPAAGQCLAAAQADALTAIFGGARNSRGEPLYGTFPYDTGIASGAWRGMHLGSGGNPPANATLGRDTLRNFAMTPPAPDLDPLRFDFDRDLPRTYETAAINDAVGTLHTSFAGQGGKMIVYHGLSDQAMATGVLTDWYEHLTPRDAQGPQAWARLFLVPGMTHCGGGQSTDQFDMLTAIQEWVENDRAPDRIVATGKAFPGVTRPLCPFPKVARFDGGEANDERSFSCR